MNISIPGYVGPVGLALVVLVVVAAMVLATLAKYYKKVPPSQIAIITGGKHKVVGADGKTTERGYHLVSGGGVLVNPLTESFDVMSLNVRGYDVTVTDAPSLDGVKITVIVAANVKIDSDQGALPLAVERFQGTTLDEQRKIIENTLDGNLRGVIGRMTVEQLVNDRTAFGQEILAEAGNDLGKMGLKIDVAKIKSITDAHGYIDALGKKRTAGVVRDASVGEADARRETDVQVAAANQAGATAKAAAEQAVSDAERSRDIAIADNQAQVKARQAVIPIAANIAAAERTGELNTATVKADQARIQAEIQLETIRAERNAAQLNATTVVTAEKDREAAIITADAERQSAELKGEAFRLQSSKEGEGEKAKQEGIAAGRKALASALQAEQEASAAGNQAQLLATATGVRADLEAKAAGQLAMAGATRAQLLAEAEGTLKRAEAFAALDDAGRFLMILEALPPVILAAGEAGERVMKPMAEAIGQGLGNIKEVRIVDLGGGQSGGQSLVERFAASPVNAMFSVWEQVKAAGMEPFARGLAGRFGVNVDDFLARGAAATEPPIDGQVIRAAAPQGDAAATGDERSETGV